MIFIERILYRELKAGVDRMIADSDLYEAFLIDGLSWPEMTREQFIEVKDEALRARQSFEAAPPTVLHGYARVDGVFPCFAIVLGSEQNDQDFVGEDAMGSYLADVTDSESRQVYLDDDGNRIDPQIKRWSHNYDVLTYVDHPDLCLYYYYLAKQILVEAHAEFIAADLDDVTLSGAELAPDTRYLPSGMFVRRLGVKVTSDLSYIEPRRTIFGSSVAGAHVAENDSDATGTTPLITTYLE